MKIFDLSKFTRGWFIGDFEPTIVQTKDFECAVKYYKSGETEVRHVHKIAYEITVIVFGTFEMNGKILSPGDIVHLKPGEDTDFICLEDGATTVVKSPSVQNDKFEL